MNPAAATLIERSRREREDWRYTDVEKLLGTMKPAPTSANDVLPDMPSLVADASQRQRIVFIGGAWQKDRTQFGSLPTDLVQGDTTQGYRLVFAAQTCLVPAPVELVFIGSGEADVKLAIDVGVSTSLTLIEHHLGGSGVRTIETDIRLQAQAKLMHEKIIHEAKDAAHFSRTHVQVDAGAYYRNFNLVMKAQLLRGEIDVTLAGRMAQCGLYGAMLLQGREHADIQIRMHHTAPEGTSRQLYKAVVRDQARGVFQGRIKVAEGAQKTDGQQLCRALLLSDQAEMDAKPELEIYADDVACSHGCAIGDIDAEAMFYLRTRGLSENEARALLMRAFVDEVIDTLQTDEAQAYVRNLAAGWMHE